MRKKISVIGVGNVGREIAAWCAIKELGDIVMWNRTKEKAIGNALDLLESSPLLGFDVKIKGTQELKQTKNSDIIIFTAGLPRKTGMTREDLVDKNAKVVFPLIKKLAKLSPKSIIIMVTNPLDAMTYVALKSSDFPRKRVIGMAGILDSSRFKSFIANELGVSSKEISALVLGSHGENMIPLPRLTTVGGISLTELLDAKKINSLVRHTKDAGAEIISFLNANASFSVGASVVQLVESIIRDKKEIFPCSVYLKGEYDVKNICAGVPCVIGNSGMEKIIQLRLNKQEKKQFEGAIKRIREMKNSIKI